MLAHSIATSFKCGGIEEADAEPRFAGFERAEALCCIEAPLGAALVLCAVSVAAIATDPARNSRRSIMANSPFGTKFAAVVPQDKRYLFRLAISFGNALTWTALNFRSTRSGLLKPQRAISASHARRRSCASLRLRLATRSRRSKRAWDAAYFAECREV